MRPVMQVRWTKKEFAEIKAACDQDEIAASELVHRAVYEYLLRRSNQHIAEPKECVSAYLDRLRDQEMAADAIRAASGPGDAAQLDALAKRDQL